MHIEIKKWLKLSIDNDTWHFIAEKYQECCILHVKNKITGKQSNLPPFVIFNHSQNSMHYLVCIVQDRKLTISQKCLQLLHQIDVHPVTHLSYKTENWPMCGFPRSGHKSVLNNLHAFLQGILWAKSRYCLTKHAKVMALCLEDCYITRNGKNRCVNPVMARDTVVMDCFVL